jgi:hypothetical protein
VSNTYNLSDEVLKENVRVIPNALEVVERMNGCFFTWKNDERVGDRMGQETVGVIAQQVQSAGATLCVTRSTETDLLAVDYTKMVPYLIESCKTLSEEVKSLKRRCDVLEEEVASHPTAWKGRRVVLFQYWMHQDGVTPVGDGWDDDHPLNTGEREPESYFSDATTPRPWPPPDGVRKCLAWRNKDEGWFTIAIEPELLTDEYIWRGCGVIAVNRFPPKFWLPMPPAPEVGP